VDKFIPQDVPDGGEVALLLRRSELVAYPIFGGGCLRLL